MSVSKFLKNAGWATIAAATVLTAIPAAAAPADGRDRGERASASQSRGQDRPQRSTAPRQGEQRNAPQSRGNDGQRPAQVAQDRGQRPAQVAQSGSQRPAQVAQVREQRPQATPRRDDRPSRPVAQQTTPRGEQRGVSQARNTTYADRTRDRTYGGQGDRNGGNDNRWQNNRGDNDRRGDDRDNRYNDSRWRDEHGNWRRWDNNHWRKDNRYDWHRYRSYNRSVFHIGTYYAPYRYYSYRPLGIGYRMDSLFYGNRYWINDPWQYRLPAAYGPYRWVRYYDDVLLVDIYSGQVVDVIHNFFW